MKPLSRWVFVSAPAVVVAGILLALTIRSLLRTLRSSVVATLPLASGQAVRFDAPGTYDLYGEANFGSANFSGLDFAMTDSDGRDVPMHAVTFRTVVRTMSGVRLQLRSFEIPRAATYTLRVTDAADRSGDIRVVVGRPVQARVVAHILALVVLGAATIGSLVATALLIARPTLQR